MNYSAIIEFMIRCRFFGKVTVTPHQNLNECHKCQKLLWSFEFYHLFESYLGSKTKKYPYEKLKIVTNKSFQKLISIADSKIIFISDHKL